jgi:hypothetical protein
MNNTQAKFKKRVEAHYSYQFKRGERWMLFDGVLIVIHPKRRPIIVRKGGKIEQIEPHSDGDNRRHGGANETCKPSLRHSLVLP